MVPSKVTMCMHCSFTRGNEIRNLEVVSRSREATTLQTKTTDLRCLRTAVCEFLRPPSGGLCPKTHLGTCEYGQSRQQVSHDGMEQDRWR